MYIDIEAIFHAMFIGSLMLFLVYIGLEIAISIITDTSTWVSDTYKRVKQWIH